MSLDQPRPQLVDGRAAGAHHVSQPITPIRTDWLQQRCSFDFAVYFNSSAGIRSAVDLDVAIEHFAPARN
jgi:hypothetical protein